GERQIEQREARDREAVRGGGERERRARREPEQRRGAPCALDEAVDVLDLALDGVRCAIAAAAAAAPVVVEDGVRGGERGGERRAGRAGVERAEDENHRRSLADLIECKGGSHGRLDDRRRKN